MYLFEHQDLLLLFVIKSTKSLSTLITTFSPISTLDQEPAINSYHVVTLTIMHLAILICVICYSSETQYIFDLKMSFCGLKSKLKRHPWVQTSTSITAVH